MTVAKDQYWRVEKLENDELSKDHRAPIITDGCSIVREMSGNQASQPDLVLLCPQRDEATSN
jgi:hypothetical protein